MRIVDSAFEDFFQGPSGWHDLDGSLFAQLDLHIRGDSGWERVCSAGDAARELQLQDVSNLVAGSE